MKNNKIHKKPQKTGKKARITTKARQEKFITAFLEQRFNVSAACRDCDIDRKTFYRWKTNALFLQKFEDAIEERLDLAEASLFKNIEAGAEASTIFFLKTKGRRRGYGDKSIPSKEAISIITDLLSEKINPKEAAYKLYLLGEQIPDVMKIELEKTPVELPPPELPPAMDDDELEAAYQRKKAELEERDKAFLPIRRAEVQEIKEELKNLDSFGPTAEMGGIQKKGG